MRILSGLITLMFFVITATSSLAITAQKDGKSVEVPVCGGFIGLVCQADQWCDYPAGAACGMADQFGTCRPRPEICTKEYMPVCGCDGKTYGNACEAAAAGLAVAHAGACPGEGKE